MVIRDIFFSLTKYELMRFYDICLTKFLDPSRPQMLISCSFCAPALLSRNRAAVNAFFFTVPLFHKLLWWTAHMMVYTSSADHYTEANKVWTDQNKPASAIKGIAQAV